MAAVPGDSVNRSRLAVRSILFLVPGVVWDSHVRGCFRGETACGCLARRSCACSSRCGSLRGRLAFNLQCFVSTPDLIVWREFLPLLQVSTPQQAQAIVSASRFPPTGTRGFGSPFTQASWGLSTAEYLQHANDGVLVLVQVETRQALENIEEICSVDGLGARFVCFRCGAGIQTG